MRPPSILLRVEKWLRALWVLTAVFLALLSFHCGVTQPVRVAEKGTTRVTASLGGPLLKLAGTGVPAPYLTVGAIHGVTSDVTAIGRLHATALLFGDLGFDGGVAAALLRQRGFLPEITVRGEFYLFSDLRSGGATRLYPFLALNASYEVGESVLVYAGAENMIQLRGTEQFVAPLAGVEFPLSQKIAMQVEVKWMAANVSTAHGVFEGYGSLSGRGALGTFVGVTYRW
jgi:hypothetical protein